MPGKKGASGGSRPAVRFDDGRGGAGRKQGRLITSGIAPFDTETARSIKVLILARGWEYTAESVTKILAEWADEKWQEYDARIMRDTEATETWNGEVL